VRAAQKVLLADRFEHHDDGALQQLVFEGRDPEWPKSTVGLWNVHAAHRGHGQIALTNTTTRRMVRCERVRLVGSHLHISSDTIAACSSSAAEF